MTSGLKGIVDGVRTVSNWVERHEGEFTKVRDAMDYVTPGGLMGKLIHKSKDYSLGQARRFADGIEHVLGWTMAYNLGTTTLIDSPRF